MAYIVATLSTWMISDWIEAYNKYYPYSYDPRGRMPEVGDTLELQTVTYKVLKIDAEHDYLLTEVRFR
jgi:hypothetical protein